MSTLARSRTGALAQRGCTDRPRVTAAVESDADDSGRLTSGASLKGARGVCNPASCEVAMRSSSDAKASGSSMR
jgi:hypothetical protein